MRTSTRLVVSTVFLGGGLLLASPVAAQEATPCPYPGDNCPTASPTPLPSTPPLGGGSENPATGETQAPTVGGIGGGGGPAIVDQSPARADVGGATSLPFTGGEVTLIALAGTATLAAGVALVAAGRKRATA